MANNLLDSICALVTEAPELSNAERVEAQLALEDTMAVAFAGWRAPVATACRQALGSDELPFLDGGDRGAPETFAFLLATAAHALDYDDVHLVSVTHPSAVIFPALLALADHPQARRGGLLRAYAVGLAVNIAVGEALGFEHYDAGWHATSTIGGLAATAALANLLDLGAVGTRSALALAAAQAGGLQRNFGTMAKPVQAGDAAAVAVRAALLARAGVSADQDVFGPRGFLDLYGDATVQGRLGGIDLRYQMDSLSRKLFPCCYAAHRPIAAAIEARRQLPDVIPADARVALSVPFGTMRPLRVSDPVRGQEGQFCAAYVTAVALTSGGVSLLDFEDEAVRRAEIRALMARIEIIEKPPEDPLPVGLDHGCVTLTVSRGDRQLAKAEVAAFPGSPAAPATAQQIAAKTADCLALYGRTSGRDLSPNAFRIALGALAEA